MTKLKPFKIWQRAVFLTLHTLLALSILSGAVFIGDDSTSSAYAHQLAPRQEAIITPHSEVTETPLPTPTPTAKPKPVITLEPPTPTHELDKRPAGGNSF